MELRITVLQASIQIEDGLSTFLSHLFKIRKDASHTLGNKSSSLSFKTKVDLLRDLDRISNEEYSEFILFMEIRNKLIHNSGIDTMTKAVNSFDRGKKLIKIDVNAHEKYQCASSDELKEMALVLAFHALVIKLHDITANAMQKLLEEFKEQLNLEKTRILNEVNTDVVAALIKSIEKFSEIMDSAFPSNQDDIGFAKNALYAIFMKEIKTIRPDFEPSENSAYEDAEIIKQ